MAVLSSSFSESSDIFQAMHGSVAFIRTQTGSTSIHSDHRTKNVESDADMEGKFGSSWRVANYLYQQKIYDGRHFRKLAILMNQI